MSELSKLRWRCRRGMKELDLLLEAYLERRYPLATVEEQRAFKAVLDLQDPELHAYVVGRTTPADAPQAAVIQYIRAAVQT